jgi:hypothetical protein
MTVSKGRTGGEWCLIWSQDGGQSWRILHEASSDGFRIACMVRSQAAKRMHTPWKPGKEENRR